MRDDQNLREDVFGELFEKKICIVKLNLFKVNLMQQLLAVQGVRVFLKISDPQALQKLYNIFYQTIVFLSLSIKRFYSVQQYILLKVFGILKTFFTKSFILGRTCRCKLAALA